MRRSDFRRSLCLAAVAVLVGVAYALWLWSGSRSAAPPRGMEVKPTRSPAAATADVLAADGGALLDDSRCRLHRGVGAARDAAVAVVAGDADARFVVLDGGGLVFSGELPFRPERALLGRRGDGVLAAAFGGGEQDRLKVFLDGEVAADIHGALDFGLSRDGAAWFVARRNPEGAFEVEQRDTATGDRHVFAAHWLRDTGAGLSHTAAYAHVDNAIVFAPRQQDESIENAHYVYTMRGTVRMVRLGSKLQTIVESDSHIYALQKWHHQHGLAKRVFHWDAKGADRVAQAWWHPLTVAPATVRLFRSDDDAWIGLFGWRLMVLDAATGELALSFPVRGDKTAELARLRGVLPPDATVRDVGEARGARIVHGLLLVRRVVPDAPGHDRAGDSEVVDVFRLDNMRADAGPDMRLPAEDMNRCLVDTAGFPLPLVRVDADGFAYVAADRADTGGFQPSPGA